MAESHNTLPWKALRNPFQTNAEPSEGITGRVSGRSADIRNIIIGGQGAIIMTGAPNIGKTSLVRFLQQRPETGWTWRDELPDLDELLNLDHLHFLQIDLTSLEGIENASDVKRLFIEQCISSLAWLRPDKVTEYDGSRGLRVLLREILKEQPDMRCYFMLDGIERLQEPDVIPFDSYSRSHTPQERSLALLEASGVLRLLVDLLDEFPQFGVLFFLVSQPSAGVGNLYKNVSADLARFSTMLLQAFTEDDTRLYLSQKPEILGTQGSRVFMDAGVSCLFSDLEQHWLYEQAGTHPYLLKQLCFLAFQMKQQNANMRGSWIELESHEKQQLIELMNERVSAYFGRTWRRIDQALQSSGQETRDQFYEFIRTSDKWRSFDGSEQELWEQFDEELHYILRSEGIVRADPLMTVEYPGTLLKLYLEQRVREQEGPPAFRPSVPSNQKELLVTLPGQPPVSVALSDIEYRLVKTLLENPKRCSETQLMQAGWGRPIDRSVFTQRMHHLRKKLRKYTGDEDIIENRYGGKYLLSHAEWVHV